MSHASVLIFRSTGQASFPLILVIGREANTRRTINNGVGQYDFRHHPRCGFWNISYGVIARVKGWNGRQLKVQCVNYNASPIIYADALPIGIRYKVRDKKTVRAQLAQAVIREHVSTVFSHFRLIDRVQLVITSGLHSALFVPARAEIEEQCARRKIPCAHVPFFYGTNTIQIEQALSNETRQVIEKVLHEFTAFKMC